MSGLHPTGIAMNFSAELLDNPQAAGHIVQLYGRDDRLLTRNLARYLLEGLRRGDGLLVVATPEHGGTVARQLREDPLYAKAVLEGRLVFLDAQATLDRLMNNGRPDRRLFDTVVGEALRGVSQRSSNSSVRAYGEMVGLLWVAGQRAAAVELEEFWNQLLQSSDACLFCAYPIDIFGSEFQSENIDAVLCSHTHLLPIDDALESALHRAMDEVLGGRADGLRALIKPNHRPSWGAIPKSEAIILWLRNNLPGSAAEIVELAKRYYRDLAAGPLELGRRSPAVQG